MEVIPKDWVDKIFSCMSQFYSSRWDRNFDESGRESFFKTIWQSGLTGLTYDQIIYALKLFKKDSENPRAIPPHVMEFFRYAKGTERPYEYRKSSNE